MHSDDVNSLWALITSFAIAFAVGWWGFRLDSGDGGPQPEVEFKSKNGRSMPLTAEVIVAKHNKVKAGESVSRKVEIEAMTRRWNEENERFQKLSESFVLSDNPSAQYEEALNLIRSDATCWAELRVVILHWLRRDVDGYLTFHAALPVEKRDFSCFVSAMAEWSGGLTVDQNISLLGKPLFSGDPDKGGPIVRQLVKASLEGGRFDDAVEMMARIPESFKMVFKHQLASECPPELRSEAFKWLIDQGDAARIRELAGTVVLADGVTTWNASWVREMVEKYPETKEALIKDGLYQNIMMNEWKQLPLEQRIDEMAAGSPFPGPADGKRQQAVEYCCNVVAIQMIGTGSFSLEMAAGGITSEVELVEKLGSDARALYAAYPEALRKAVFPYWVLNDPVAALAAVSHLPSQEREQMVIRAASAGIVAQTGDAERLYRLFQAFPAKPEQGPLQARFNCWGAVSGKAHSEYGDSYVAWLRALPHSVDRDMAMAALAQTIKGSDPELSARLLIEKNNPGGGR
jgi:hypothetical protein